MLDCIPKNCEVEVNCHSVRKPEKTVESYFILAASRTGFLVELGTVEEKENAFKKFEEEAFVCSFLFI